MTQEQIDKIHELIDNINWLDRSSGALTNDEVYGHGRAVDMVVGAEGYGYECLAGFLDRMPYQTEDAGNIWTTNMDDWELFYDKEEFEAKYGEEAYHEYVNEARHLNSLIICRIVDEAHAWVDEVNARYGTRFSFSGEVEEG